MFSPSFNTYTPCCTSKLIDIKKIFEVLKFESTIHVNNEVLDFNPVYTCKVYIPKNIPNTKKRKTYSERLYYTYSNLKIFYLKKIDLI